MRREILQRVQLARQYEPRYQRLLLSDRDRAIKSALNAIKGYRSDEFISVVSSELKEPYLEGIYAGLYQNIGIAGGDKAIEHFTSRIGVKSTPVWQHKINNYLDNYTGKRIVSVAGTFKDEVIGWMQDALSMAPEMGIEEITNYIYDDVIGSWNKLKEWQVRRIVQTESMAALGVGQDAAVRSLGIRFSKTWAATFINTRPQHVAMDGIRIGMDEIFILPNGDRMMFPSDFSLGASAKNLINCSCGIYNDPA